MRVVFAVAVLLIAAAPARAATVELRVTDYNDRLGRYTEHLGVVTAAAGEADRLEVGGGEGLVVRGAGLVAGPGCTGGGAEVTCPAPVTQVQAFLGDGSDVLEATRRYVSVEAGAGDDVISGVGSARGGPGADVIAGGDSLNLLDGGPGPDRVSGLDGDDEIRGGEGADTVDGGPGRDSLRYDDHTEGVRVDLAAGTGGAPGENDSIAGIEWVSGGPGPDVLLGTDADEDLMGMDGDDVVDGRGGDDHVAGHRGDDSVEGGPGDDNVTDWKGRDRLSGGEGDDRLADVDGDFMSGGPGDDLLDTMYAIGRPHRRVVVRCGPGDDRVAAETVHVRTASDCEAAGWNEVVMLEGPRLRAGILSWHVRPDRVRARRRFEVRVRLPGGRLAGRGRFTLNRDRVVRVRLDRRGRRSLRRPGPQRLRVTVLWGRGVEAAWTAAV